MATSQMIAEYNLHRNPPLASSLWPWQLHTRLAWYKAQLRNERNGYVLLDNTRETLKWDVNEAELWHNLTALLSMSGDELETEKAFYNLLRLNPVLKAQAVAAAAKANSTGGKERDHD